MTSAQKQWMAEVLNRFPLVRWDRLAGAGTHRNVFGWIDRRDGRYDFLVLMLELPTEGKAGTAGYVTSSAALSPLMDEALGGEPGGHVPCQRVEAELGALVENVVHL